MKVVLQRVSRASVSVDDEIVGAIAAGFLLLVGVAEGDSDADVEVLVDKICGLRVFPDGDSKMNLSLHDVGGEALVVSQFTLYASTRRGRRPSFTDAAEPAHARVLVEEFVQALRSRGIPTAEGRFGASMSVELVNDGPVTLILESESGKLR